MKTSSLNFLVLFCLALTLLTTRPDLASADDFKTSWVIQNSELSVLHLDGAKTDDRDNYLNAIRMLPNVQENINILNSIHDHIFYPFPIFNLIYKWFDTEIFNDSLSDFAPNEPEEAVFYPESFLWSSKFSTFYPDALEDDDLFSISNSTIILEKEKNFNIHAGLFKFLPAKYDVEIKPILTHLVPDHKLASISVSILGLKNSSILGLNEAGLSFSFQIVKNKNITLDGSPFLIIASEIMENAHSIDEATEILKHFNRTCDMNIFLTHGKEKAILRTHQETVELERLNMKNWSELTMNNFPSHTNSIKQYLSNILTQSGSATTLAFLIDPKNKSIALKSMRGKWKQFQFHDIRSSNKPTIFK